MAALRAMLVAILGAILVACSTGAQPTQPERASAAPSVAIPSPSSPGHPPSTLVVTPTPVAMSTPMAMPTPTPTSKPTLRPAPPKPTGLQSQTPCLLDCDPTDNFQYGVTWKAPRAKGIEIRVYGVTKCFRTDADEGRCLRRGTKLPDGVRVLLAKGPASEGELYCGDVFSAEDDPTDGCDSLRETEDGTRFYSIVAAAYRDDEHSIFVIVDAGGYGPEEECGGVDLPG